MRYLDENEDSFFDCSNQSQPHAHDLNHCLLENLHPGADRAHGFNDRAKSKLVPGRAETPLKAASLNRRLRIPISRLSENQEHTDIPRLGQRRDQHKVSNAL